MAQDFLVIPIKVIDDKRLQHGDAILYARILFRNRLAQGCIESNISLAKFLKEGTSTTRRRIERLEKYGYIKREFGAVDKYSRIKIIPLIGVLNIEQVKPTYSVGGLLKNEQGVAHYRAQNNNKSNIYNINNTKSLYKPVDNSRVKGYKSVTELARKAGIKFR